jgi:hypothetical protein
MIRRIAIGAGLFTAFAIIFALVMWASVQFAGA